MKKLNITKKQYDESKYFNNKYGSIKFVSESGKLFKTDKGVVLSLEASKKPFTMKEETNDVPPTENNPVTEETDEVEEISAEEETINKEEVAAALADVVDTIKAIADDNDIEVPGLTDGDEGDEDEEEFEELDEGECKDGECKGGKCKCECGDKKPVRESAKRAARAKLIREAIAKRARIRKIKESIERRARARKVLESIKARRAAKKLMESKKFRKVK